MKYLSSSLWVLSVPGCDLPKLTVCKPELGNIPLLWLLDHTASLLTVLKTFSKTSARSDSLVYLLNQVKNDFLSDYSQTEFLLWIIKRAADHSAKPFAKQNSSP